MTAPTVKSQQERADNAVAELAECYRRTALDSVESWRQVPLMALLANGRSGYSGDLSETASTGAYSLQGHHASGVLVECRTGELVVPYDGYRRASDLSVLGEAFDVKHLGKLKGFDGAAVLEGLLDQCTQPCASYIDAAKTHAYWVERIATERVGFVAGWEGRGDVLGTVSEHLVVLARDWSGSVKDLLAAAMASADAEEAPEVQALAVMDPDVVLEV
jgi:hypothetical protein